MKYFTLLLSFFSFSVTLLAQNVVISTQNPDNLFVCGADQMTVTMQNGAGPAATNLKATITLPNGVSYLQGSVAGAAEGNISNLNAPVFDLADLVGGASVSFTINVTAACPILQDINAGLTFSNTIVATYAGGSKQFVSNLYPVATGFVNINSVSPPTVSGQKGDVIMRMITLRNTRSGPIQSLQVTDVHSAGISIQLEGGINQSNLPAIFNGEIPGSFFSSVGNGDNLLDFNEEITLVQKVTIEDCGIPSTTNQSLIIVGWGCNGSICQQDSVFANITILPTTQNPVLSFIPIYTAPLSQCGTTPATQEILIVNTGELVAMNVVLNPYTLDTSFHALDQGSVEWNNGSGWQTLSTLANTPTELASCGISDYSESLVLQVPEVLPGDTVRVRFNTYYCQEICGGLIPKMRVGFNYFKACPANVSSGGVFDVFPDTSFLKIQASVDYELENCLQEGETYTLNYWVKSGRLLQETGFLQVIFEIPLGFNWDPSCPFSLDGQTPLESEINPNSDGSSTVRMVFQLPFSQDSVSSELCLRYQCEQDMPCASPVPNVPPRGLDYTVFPPPSDCGGCQLILQAYSLFSVTPNDAIDCAITYCDEFILVVDNHCDTSGGGGGGGGGGFGGGSLILVDFDSYRTNYGLQDNNDDRMADNNNTANVAGVRRDRFIVGDTLRTEIRAFMAQGTLSTLDFRVFLESWLSDFDTLDADTYDVTAGKLLFANYDTTSFVSALLTIKTTTGETYSCPVELPEIRSDQHIIQVAEPNIRPVQVVDIGSNMFHEFNLNFGNPACFPPGFMLSAGDSLIFTSDFKFESNFVPDGSNAPPLINFRNSICDTDKTYSWELEDFCSEKKICQFSGYLETVAPNILRIEPCAQSTEIAPFQYQIRIARANMFPFEVRQLSTVTGFSFSLPGNVGIVDSRLNFLELQDNVPLFGSTYVNPTAPGSKAFLDLSPFFADPLDEGYSFGISARFDTTCGYAGTAFNTTEVDMLYANPCIKNPVDSGFNLTNPNGYQNGSPLLELFTQNEVLYLPTDEFLFNFFLRNNSPVNAQNAWLTIESDGSLADLQLLSMPSQTPIPQIGGVYQLGELLSFAQPALRVLARNLSCRPVTVTFRFGWDCSPVYNSNGDACGNFSKTIQIRPLLPELELVVLNQPPTIPMCEPSAVFEFEVSNANDGSAYNIVPSIKLPPGIRIVPGSSQLAFPAGGAFVNMPNPVQLPGNIWQFDPQAASTNLAQNGLISADNAPLNALRIRFRVLAECGVVANAQPIYGAESLRSCGIVSNVLRRPGLPIGIEGIEPTYTAVSNLQFTNPPGIAGCGQEIELSASIAVNDTPMSGDSIYVLLPVGTSYVNGSYQSGVNAPGGPPQVSGQQIQLPLPTNIGSGSVLNFSFRIRYDDPAGCADKLVILQTREQAQAFCPSNNQLCNISVATGESLLDLNAQNPEIQLNNFNLNTAGGQTTFQAVLENAGNSIATNPVMQLYHDLNGNGQIDPSDPLVATVNATGSIAPGGVLSIAGNLNNLPATAFCDLIGLIPAEENCACTDRIFSLKGDQVVTEIIKICDLEAVNVGTPEVAGNTYNWLTPAGLSCTNCPNAVYTPGPEVMPGELVTLVLQEKAGECTIERRYEIQFGGAFGIETEDQTICAGEPVTLNATEGGTAYNWSGPGITNPNQSTQIVQPDTSANYSVTVTFSGGCTGTGMVAVLVNPASTIELPALTTCEGSPVLILGNTTDVPGIYTLELQKLNGCDSIIIQELIVEPTNIEETLALCEGDTATVYDSTFTQSGRICKTEVSPTTGCVVTTCVNVTEVPNPQVPEQDEALVVAKGESVVIETPDDFITYEWTPFDSNVLSCGDCPDPEASPDTSTRFILIVTDENGCRDTAQYRIFVCDEAQIDIPNAFTPNGDGANDFFRVVPHEGAEVIRFLRVYSRWGQLVYEGSGTNAQWDGRIGNQPAPSDVYVWVLDYVCGGNDARESGDVTLLR